MSSVVICWTSSAGRARWSGTRPSGTASCRCSRSGRSPAAAARRRTSAAWAAAACRGGGGGGLLLGGDGQLGLVHLLVDRRSAAAAAFADELARLGGGCRVPRPAAGGEQPGRGGDERRPQGQRRHANGARVVVRVDCTVGLRLRAPGPGKGPHSMRVRTDGREPLSTSSGGRAGQLLRIAPLVTAVSRRPIRHFRTEWCIECRRNVRPDAHSTREECARAHSHARRGRRPR